MRYSVLSPLVASASYSAWVRHRISVTSPVKAMALLSPTWTWLITLAYRNQRPGAGAGGRSGGARGRFPGAARAQAAPLHEPERRQAPPFGGMSGGRAFQIGPAHEGGGPGRGNPPDVEVFRLGNSGTIVSLWHFCISFSDAYTEGRGVTAWRLRRHPDQSPRRAALSPRSTGTRSQRVQQRRERVRFRSRVPL